MKKDKNNNREESFVEQALESDLPEALMASEEDQVLEITEKGDIDVVNVAEITLEAVTNTVEEPKSDILELPTFSKKAFKKYEQDEVDEFVTPLVESFNELLTKFKASEKKIERMSKAQKEVTELRKTIKSLNASIKELEERTPDDDALAIIAEAQLKADSIIANASNEAIRVSNEAEKEAAEVISNAKKDSHETIVYAENEAKSIVVKAKSTSTQIINDAKESASSLKAAAEVLAKSANASLARKEEVIKRMKDFYQSQIDLLNAEESKDSE